MTQLPALSGLGTEINERHVLAIQHASKALEHAIACGDLLIEAKSKAQHGQWLPWLRQNIGFSERTCQSYMRLAHRVSKQIRSGAADLSVRRVLQDLSTPRRHDRAALDDELEQWLEQHQAISANRPEPGEWSLEDAQACADSLRAIDSILHRHGLCLEEFEGCLVCSDEARL